MPAGKRSAWNGNQLVFKSNKITKQPNKKTFLKREKKNEETYYDFNIRNGFLLAACSGSNSLLVIALITQEVTIPIQKKVEKNKSLHSGTQWAVLVKKH